MKYDNYDAIEIPFVDAIPSDYKGAMGVPITFMDKYCPEQFEIIWQASGNAYANAPREVLEMLHFDPTIKIWWWAWSGCCCRKSSIFTNPY